MEVQGHSHFKPVNLEHSLSEEHEQDDETQRETRATTPVQRRKPGSPYLITYKGSYITIFRLLKNPKGTLQSKKILK